MGALAKAGLIAGGILAAVYAALGHVGALAGGSFQLAGNTNGAQTLTAIVGELYGTLGILLLAGIFVLACMNTCVGLLCSVSEYFYTLIPSIGYRKWLLIFAGFSMVISNAGLDLILKISVPVLSAIYPVCIVLIMLAFLQKYIGGLKYVYPLTIIVTIIASLLDLGGLGWILPSMGAIILGAMISVVAGGKEKR